jgi:hypothetical protein
VSVFDPNRGRIPSPDLDDRTWKEIVDQAISLIPRYAPQWTDHGPSDIGITLIELFAWLVEGLIFRLNQVPEKNYVAFLNLLGITRNPPEPARTFLTFSVVGESRILKAGLQAQTAATESGDPVVFETDEDARVLPINLDTALRVEPDARDKLHYTNVSTSFAVSPAKGETLLIPPSVTIRLLLGFDGSTTEAIKLPFRLSRPLSLAGKVPDPEAVLQVKVTWSYSKGELDPTGWDPFDPVVDGTRRLSEDGTVEFKPPEDWVKQKPDWPDLPAAAGTPAVDQPKFWLALNIGNTGNEPLSVGIDRVLFNAVSAHSALTVRQSEKLGISDGTPFQVFQLANGPLFRQPRSGDLYAHLKVSVDGEVWRQATDFEEKADKSYRLDPVTAEISFGNYDRLLDTGHGLIPREGTGHGLIPREGASIVAEGYRYVTGGAAANVGGESVIALREKVAGVQRVSNLAAAYGGADQEPIEKAKRRAPELLRNRNRAVTKEDYEYLAMQASTELASACCLGPQYDADTASPGSEFTGGIDRSAGNVNVILVPAQGIEVSDRPSLSPELAHEVLAFLDRRRDVATRLQVHSPRYLPIDVQVTAMAWKEARESGLIEGPADVMHYIEGRLKLYLHPVDGGLDGQGWRVGESVQIADLYRFASPPEKWGFISSLTIKPGSPEARRNAERNAAGAARVQLADFELACAGQVIFAPEVAEV